MSADNSPAPAEVLARRNGLDWQLNARREILWTRTCPQTRAAVVDVKSPVNRLQILQIAVRTASFPDFRPSYSIALVSSRYITGFMYNCGWLLCQLLRVLDDVAGSQALLESLLIL